MKFPRKAQLWLADRHPAFDRPGLYRRPPIATGPTASGWDALLIGMGSLVLILVGAFGLVIALFLVVTIIATWLG